jgi:Domain of unknown function (DUF6748)
MLKFVFIRAAVVTAVVTSLTFCLGANPYSAENPIKTQPTHFPVTVVRDLRGSSDDPLRDAAGTALLTTPLVDSLTSTSTYYTLRPDFRRCAFPLCGGYFVKRVNQSLTRCANGRYMAECYVAEIDWNNLPQVDARTALVRGSVVVKTFRRFGNLGALRVTESWRAASGNGPTGIFYRVKDRGVRCITFPCPTHHEAKLNSTASRNIAGVDLSGAGANDQLLSEATTGMAQTDGILVAGSHLPVTGPAGTSSTLKATQFYLRAGKQVATKPPVTKPGAMKRCIKTGCSNQICADHDVITTCEYRPEYACYEKARCERQADGNCGFTRTPELTSCLAGK